MPTRRLLRPFPISLAGHVGMHPMWRRMGIGSRDVFWMRNTDLGITQRAPGPNIANCISMAIGLLNRRSRE